MTTNFDGETEEGRANLALLYQIARCNVLLDVNTKHIEQAMEYLDFTSPDSDFTCRARGQIFSLAERGLKRHLKEQP